MPDLAELRRLAEAATPGPYFVALDDALDTIQHRNSGLAMVDTGRESDWPIARLQEWHDARYIAACSPERILAMLDVIAAADNLSRACVSIGHGQTSPSQECPICRRIDEWNTARAKLEHEGER
jgi:hypothetical protein